MQRRYETLLLFSPELPPDATKATLENFQGVIKNQGGEMVTLDDWGMKELAYPVKKQFRGHYVRLEYMMPAASVSELERIIRIADGIFKFVTVKLPEKKQEPTPAAEA